MRIGSRELSADKATYFIADISANHDGDLNRAIGLIHLAADSGANAAKFQNFRAEKIVSGRGFATLPGKLSHQAKWSKSVVEVYKDASLPWEWTEALCTECKNAGIDFLSTPYDLEAVDMLQPFVPAFKIGSGDITWDEMLRKIAGMKKPVILATGASNIGEVQHAVEIIEAAQVPLCLMQCNTNYTGDIENFKYINLKVLETYRVMFPNTLIGLSDHTPRHATVLGAVALGARVIEKHLTDDTSREGPDHPFSMTPATWREMVDRTRELEFALGDANKRVAQNERDTVVVQRRCLRAARPLSAGERLEREMIAVLRPAPSHGISPNDIDRIIGTVLRDDLAEGEALGWHMLQDAPRDN